MQRSRKEKKEDSIIYTKRILIMGAVSTIIILALLLRLFFLQIIKHDFYTTEVNKQRNLTIPLTSGRGTIYDRNFIPLTDREEETIGVIYPQLFHTSDENLKFLSELTGISSLELENRISRTGYLIELSIKENLDWNDRRLVNTRGLFIVEKRNRYDEDNLLRHVIGYISGVDKRGMSGIERSQDIILKEQQGRAIAAVLDGKKRLLPGEGYVLVNGNMEEKHVKLTVDYHIQSIAENVLDNTRHRGTVIISNVETGEILAMASRPNFNPNEITKHLKSDGDELFNKAIQMTFPPGSIFKIIVAAAALEEGLLDVKEVFNCLGSESVGNVQIRCNSHSQGGNGEIIFEKAFAESCNSTFIQLGQRIGAMKIIEMAEKLGFNSKVNIGLVEEEKGNLPTGDYLLGPSIGNISIGQGQIEVTPLQVNQMTQIIANGGVKKQLYLIDEVVNQLHEKIEEVEEIVEIEGIEGIEEIEGIEISNESVQEEKQLLSKETIQKLQHMMGLVMEAGTGKTVGELANITAGKTGTAQATERGQSVLHAWFTGYYPKEEPKYAVTVLLQNGQSGGRNAVPVFKEIIEEMVKLGY